MSDKVDYQKQFPDIYRPSAKKCSVVKVPAMNYLMVDGHGNPNECAKFQSACEMLFSVSYALKFAIKKSQLQIDYRVYPLEGLWWTDNMDDFNVKNKDIWK
ncbi:hypothetical protein [Pseudodesulfovibrio sediminis]|uniref:GyrI-like small molecule binding domain-containing protein n=1 Tax=Pseudodesulfovibrio sediminis TaxID=2810563 RepID=A0ABM7P766_9BACT|nr:hypothetical protein PSDVSF_20020 [Pseudodesulfovibrio sediminis]